METDELIHALSDGLQPIRRLDPPSVRALRWFALALPAIAMVVAIMGLRPDLAHKFAEPRFVAQQCAALATALAAAVAAFAAVIPGTPRWRLAIPLIPLAVWLGSLGQQCFQEWLSVGPAGMQFAPDSICIPVIAMIAAVPAGTIVWMIRRGVAIYPRASVLLAGLAAAALGDVGLRLFHSQDAGLMVLVWQFGSVALFSSVAGILGERLLKTRPKADPEPRRR